MLKLGKAIIWYVVICWISVPGLVMSQLTLIPNICTGNVNLLLGEKILDDDDWELVDEQFEGAFY
jgi:hypothetical protein